MTENAIIENLKIIAKSKQFQEALLELAGEMVPPPANECQIAEVEQQLGFPIPRFLKRIYLEVANGCIGWVDGRMGLPPDIGWVDGLEGLPPDGWDIGSEWFVGNTYPDLEESFIELAPDGSGFLITLPGVDEDQVLFWPNGLLEITRDDSQAGLRFAVNCFDETTPVYRVDILDDHGLRSKYGMNGLPPGWERMTGYVGKEANSIADWFAAWIEHVNARFQLTLME